MAYKREIFTEFTHEISAYMLHRPAQDLSETETWIQKSLVELEQGTSLSLVILRRGSEEFLGCVGLHGLHEGKPAFRVWLKQSAHGSRYGLQAVRALKQWAEANLEYQVLRYPVVRNNQPSRNIPEALGAIQTREYELLNQSQRILDVVEYEFPRSGLARKPSLLTRSPGALVQLPSRFPLPASA